MNSEQKVLVTGNGFDLHHCLPTRYSDFLDVIKRLMEMDKEGNIDRCQFLTYVLGEQSPLYNSNTMIKKCYDVHKAVIDKTRLNTKKLQEMVSIAKENFWMIYFLERDIKRVGWIDFEKEIARVIRAFRNVIKELDQKCMNNQGYEVCLEDLVVSMEDYYIVTSEAFHELFYYDEYTRLNQEFWNTQIIENEIRYLSADSRKIAEKLYQSLEEFIEILKWYITEFVQKIAVTQKSKMATLFDCDRVITFNYTNTFSILYDKHGWLPVSFVHGSAKEGNMVLGVNDDKCDQLKGLDLSFVAFKKYYQRTYKNTDYDFEKNLPNGSKYKLYFVGHSMDVTDQDILRALIRDSKVTQSIIFYHDDESHQQVIKNVIALFGKDEFENLRRKHKVTFEKLGSFE